MCRIRPGTADDESSWLALRAALWPDTAELDHRLEMQRWLAEPHRYGQFIAFDADSPVGFAEVALRFEHVNGTDSSPVGFLEGIYVVPAARRRGIARELVAACETWARARGCREFASDADSGNAASHLMHRALGFDETERVVCFCKRL